MKLIWGREPTLVLAAVGAVLTVLAALNVPHVDAGAAAAITAFVTTSVMAWATRPRAPVLFTGIVTAGAALLAEYGLDLPPTTVAAISAAVLTLLALISREQVKPKSARGGSAGHPEEPGQADHQAPQAHTRSGASVSGSLLNAAARSRDGDPSVR